MRQLLAPALVSALLALPALSPAPATAAVAVHTYQITGGTSSGLLNIGAITAGGFTVQYPIAPCFYCAATLLTFMAIYGTLGTYPALSVGAIASFNKYKVTGFNTTSRQKGTWFRPQPQTPSQFTSIIQFAHYGTNTNILIGSVFHRRLHPTYIAGRIDFTGHEVAVPEPSSSALLMTGGLMLGAYALRRARRSLG